MATTVEKKIIILSGISDKSTATAILNHTPYGVSVQLSAKMLCLHIDKLTLIVRCGSVRELVDVGNSNKVCLKVLLKHDIADWDNIHCIIANNVNGNLTPLLYGTNAQKVLWQGNMLDGIIVEKNFDNVEQDMILPMQSSQEEVVVTYSQNNLQDSIDSKLAQSKEQMHSKVVEVDLDTQNSNIEQTIIQPKQLIDSLEQVPILPQFDEVFN
ncbi:MAG: hypothetical protein FWF58_03640, partial [Firmicutes bacterium]|nr:hypothetical protein [Bacillota bacterium]